MDPVTHLTSGALGRGALQSYQKDRHMVLFCIIAALLPDIDNIIGLLGPELYLIHHRGATHSLAGGIILALVLVLTFRLLIKSFNIKKGFVTALSLIFLHIFLDLVTSYGTQVFYPFTNRRYSIESVFIVDPVYTLVSAIIFFISLIDKKRKKIIAITGIIWIFIYPAINLGIKKYLEKSVENELKKQDGISYSVHLSPDILTPFSWKVIVEDGEKYGFAGVKLIGRKPVAFLGRFNKAGKEMFDKFGKDASIFNTYAWFAEYPVFETEKSGKKNLIIFGDLRFSSTSNFAGRVYRNGRKPFSLTAVLDEEGKFIEYYYQKPGGVKIIHHIE
jgi:inner membrane protein